MRLTPEQQRTVETLMPDAERFARSICHRWNGDIQSTAYMALCEAVVSHDPAKSAITTWIYLKVRRALQTEWLAELKHQHVPLPQPNHLGGCDKSLVVCDDDMLVVEDMIHLLPVKHRDIFREVVLKGTTLKLLSIREGVSKQRIHQIVQSCKKRLWSKLSWMQETYSRSANGSTTPPSSSPGKKAETEPAS